MMILIRGVSFRGFGAELMIRAIVEHVRLQGRDIQCAVLMMGSFAQRAEYGLLTVLPRKRLGRSALAAALMAPSFRGAYGLASDSDLDVILDASGFAYSDQWGSERARDLLGEARRWKAAGKKIVLLPQAFGPFHAADGRESMRRALGLVDLVYARDQQSMHHLETLNANATVHVAPDFTGSVSARCPDDIRALAPYVCVAPNRRMLDMTDARTSESYVHQLSRVIAILREHRVTVVLTSHPGSDDEVICEELGASAGTGWRHFCSRDVAAMKGVLGQSEFVIGSRYHFLASGLNQGVPCIGAGWSHKYDELFVSYGCPELLVSVADGEPAFRRALDIVLDPGRRADIRKRLGQAAAVVQAETAAMWNRVDRLLGLGT